MDSIEELMEYMWLRPKVTHLNVDIFVDDGGAYVRHEHELLLFVRRSMSNVPLSVKNWMRVEDVSLWRTRRPGARKSPTCGV